MKKFPKVEYPGDGKTNGILQDDVVVTEKLDGANFRFRFTQEGLEVGTRNHSFDVYDPNIPKAFNHAIEYLQNLPEDTVNVLKGKGTLFGEAMHRHSIDYDDIDWHFPHKGSPHVALESDIPNVLVFDWYNDETEEWADWRQFEDLIADTALETAPIIEKGRPGDLDLDIPSESVFGGPPEGIVVRRFDGTIRAKKVRQDFKEQHKQAKITTQSQSEAGAFVVEYVTEPRIEKVAHKLVDKDMYEQLEMPMMEDLPEYVLKDALEESGRTNGWDEDTDFMGKVRSKTSGKCVSVLKTKINSF